MTGIGNMSLEPLTPYLVGIGYQQAAYDFSDR
jgi:hypothetical protein